MEETSNKSCRTPKHLKWKSQVILKVSNDVLDVPLDMEPRRLPIIEVLNASDNQAVQPLITCPDLVRHEAPHARNPEASCIAEENSSLERKLAKKEAIDLRMLFT